MHPHAPSGARASGARASAFRHQRLEWPARFELALRPWQGRVLPLTLRPPGASGEIRTHDLRLTEAALCPLELQRRHPRSRTRTWVRRFQGPAGCWQPIRIGAVSRCRPGSPALQGQGHSRVRRQGTGASDGGRFRFTEQQGSPCLRRCWVSSVRFERTLPAHHAGASCRWAARTWSRHPVPTRAIRRTKAEPQPCAAASLPGKDSNLDSRRSERRGLPN